MSSHTSELKAALLASFSGKTDNATWWIKAMKAYLTLNSTLYNSDTAEIMTTLNKMRSGRGASFAEIWYDKMADTLVTNSEKKIDKFYNNFKTTFYSFNLKATTWAELSKLVQKSFHCPDGTISHGFQRYITDFQNLSLKMGITDDISLIDQFSLGLNQQIATIILFITTIPTTSSTWINQAKVFHAQKMCILSLWAGCPQSHPNLSLWPQKDPNAMDIDAITLTKLTPTEWVKCMKEGQYFRCRKTGHNTQNCWVTFPPQNQSSTPHP